MKPRETSVPVVVLNAFTHCGVGVIRTLGRLNVPVYCIHGDPRAPSLRSRYRRGNFQWSISDAPAELSVEYITDIGRKIGNRPLLIPTEDAACLFVEDHAAALRAAYRFPERPPGLARSLSSKEEMHSLCTAFDIPTPEAAFPKCRADVVAFAETGSFPVMMKGVDNRQFLDEPGAGKVIARSASQLLSRYDELSRKSERDVVLQEYIPGDATSVWMFNGYFNRDSECLFSGTGYKIRQYPPYTGQTSLGICVGNDQVAALTKKFMRDVGYTGILDIGFRYDSRDGRYKLLDVNPRVGSAFRLFAGANGMDVVRALYCDMTQQPVSDSAPSDRRRWFVENYDIAASAKYFRDRALGIRAWVSSFRGVEEAAWFALDDPLPFGAMWMQSGRRLMREFGSDREKSSWWRAAPPGLSGVTDVDQ